MNPIISGIQWLADPNRSLEGYGQLKVLACALGISPQECLAIPNDRRLCYRPFTIKKKSGGERRILAPSERLKKLQRALLDSVLLAVEPHWSAMAFRKGYCVANHAQLHAHQQILLTADLRDFFSSTDASRVRKLFQTYEWTGVALKVLMRLTTFQGALPQGAPTSPKLSNLVNYELDSRLYELASMHGGLYSRYSDDLAFSWAIDEVPPRFAASATGILESYGYEIQTDKGWRLQRCADGAELPGIVIDAAGLRPADQILKRMRAIKRRWFKTETQRRQLDGYRGYAKMLRLKR